MNGQEIRKNIDLNNKKIRNALNTFVLSDNIQIIMKDTEYLRSICPHEYINGICKYCDKKEVKE